MSEGTNNTHEAVLRLVKRYQSRFEKYKRIRFEVDSFQTNGGTGGCAVIQTIDGGNGLRFDLGGGAGICMGGCANGGMV